MFSGGGEMVGRIRAFDWSSTPLGPTETWPTSLKVAVGICLQSSFPTAIYWGPELRLIYNDAWSPIPADRHPGALGQPGAEVWRDIWDVVGPQIRDVITRSKGFSTYDQMLPMQRGGVVEETYWNYSFTPILDDEGRVAGVFNQGNETTDKLLHARSQALLLNVSKRLRALADGRRPPIEAVEATLEALGRHYSAARCAYCEIDDDRRQAVTLAEWRRDGVAAPDRVRQVADYGPGFLDALTEGRVRAIEDVCADAELRLPGVGATLIAPLAREAGAPGFLLIEDDLPQRWRPHALSTLREAADHMWLAYGRAEAYRRLARSEERFAVLFDQTAVGLTEIDARGVVLRANESMARLLARDAEALPGVSIDALTHPADREKSRRLLMKCAADGEPFTVEKRYARPNGSEVWGVSTVTRLMDENARPAGFFAVTIDVSERREAESLRGLLVAELNHRVRNNIVTVQSLVRHSLATASSPEEFEQAINARLTALARAHDLLMRETWTAASLGELVDDTLSPYAVGGGRVSSDGPQILLAPTAAVTLNMALHELAVNAAKFGALSGPVGEVRVSWTVAEGQLHLVWREVGGPPVQPPSRRGFGRRLIERGATQELGGAAALSFAPGGVTCVFRIPLSQKVMAP